MKKIILLCCLFAATFGMIQSNAQITWTPTGPGCVGSPVNFSTSNNATTYHWDMAALNVNQALPSLSVLPTTGATWTTPAFGCWVQDPSTGNYSYFVTDYFAQHLWRTDYNSSLTIVGGPVDLGVFGSAGLLEGVDIVQDGAGHFYGMMVNWNELIQIDFTGGLTAPPTTVAVTAYPSDLFWTHQLTIKYYPSTLHNDWHVFVANRNSGLTRFDFGTTAASLMAPPTAVVDIPNVGSVANPCNFTLYQEPSTGDWYALVPSLINATLSLYSFGSDLMNAAPTGALLPDPNSVLDLPREVFLLNDCQGNLLGYQINETGHMIQYDFTGNITHTPTVTDMGATGGSSLGSGCPAAYNNKFSYIVPNFSSGVISIFDPFVTMSAPAYLNWWNPNQSNTFATSGTFPITLIKDMGRPSGPSVECATIRVDSCIPPCYDTNKTTLMVMALPSDPCKFIANVNVTTANTVLGYTWTVTPGGSVTHTTSATSDAFTFSIPSGTVATVTVTIHIIDKDLNCCTGVLTQTVTCGGCACFDTANTKLNAVFVGPEPGGDCDFLCTALPVLKTNCKFIGFSWQGGPIVPVNTFPITVPNGTSVVVTVVMYAIDPATGDTCTITKTVTLTCDNGIGNVHKPAKGSAGDKTAGGSDIQIFPNPTDNMVIVTATNQELTNIQIINVNGQKVGDYSFTDTKSTNISLEKLPPGTYLFKVNNSTSKVVVKN